MKTLFQQALVHLSKKDLNNLTKEVKETISFEHDMATNKKLFTSPELWRIQNLKKPVAIRRGFNL
ncbi:MAG: hypothetical protein Q8941_02645 [Bacteroidota bacterium]|nr:hypothetical protein [Bacteroidota bacterium]